MIGSQHVWTAQWQVIYLGPGPALVGLLVSHVAAQTTAPTHTNLRLLGTENLSLNLSTFPMFQDCLIQIPLTVRVAVSIPHPSRAVDRGSEVILHRFLVHSSNAGGPQRNVEPTPSLVKMPESKVHKHPEVQGPSIPQLQLSDVLEYPNRSPGSSVKLCRRFSYIPSNLWTTEDSRDGTRAKGRERARGREGEVEREGDGKITGGWWGGAQVFV